MSTSNDPQFYFEIATKFTKDKNTFWIRPHLIDLASNVNELKKRIAELTNELGTSKSDIIKRAFLAGLAVLECEIANSEVEEFFNDTSRLARIKKLLEIREKQEHFKALQEIYQGYGNDTDGFIQWCQETNQPYYQEFLNGHTMPVTFDDKNKSEKIRTWLYTNLTTEEEHSTEIKKHMVADGIISDSEKDHNLVKNVVSTENMSGKGRKPSYWSKS